MKSIRLTDGRDTRDETDSGAGEGDAGRVGVKGASGVSRGFAPRIALVT